VFLTIRDLLHVPDGQVAGGPEEEDVIDVVGGLLAFVIPVAIDGLIALVGGVAGGGAPIVVEAIGFGAAAGH